MAHFGLYLLSHALIYINLNNVQFIAENLWGQILPSHSKIKVVCFQKMLSEAQAITFGLSNVYICILSHIPLNHWHWFCWTAVRWNIKESTNNWSFLTCKDINFKWMHWICPFLGQLQNRKPWNVYLFWRLSPSLC